MSKPIKQRKIGILGGGQLGRMILQATANWDLDISILDQSKAFPAGSLTNQFTEGNFKNYEDVMAFGKDLDVITIEIEHVNLQALKDLKKMGKTVHPNPESLEIIKDKGLQKQFYQEKNIPTSPFHLFTDAADVKAAIDGETLSYPFVQKTRGEGYDGKGVQVIDGPEDLDRLFDSPSMIEEKVAILKELSVIAARNEEGQVACFPVVEMEFNPEANLVEFLRCPSDISKEVEEICLKMGKQIIEEYDICGLLAIEFFLDQDGKILVNEVAPRPHNSGHHTIEANHTSQFEQHMRGVLNLPLGDPSLIKPGVMVNLLGAAGHTGKAVYKNLEAVISEPEVYVHLYAKEITKPYRKMGHITVTADKIEDAILKARRVKELLIVEAET